MFDQLQLQQVVSALSEAASAEQRVLEIDIVEDTENAPSVSTDTVHRLHWELLETASLWATLDIRVIVRRVIPQEHDFEASIKRIDSWSGSVTSLNILLVVARDTRKNATTYEDVDPNLAFQSLWGIKRDLEIRGS